MLRSSLALCVALVAALSAPRAARACGGCFSPPPLRAESAQVVTDHRMVLALSQRQTTLWDQIKYAGAPEDFVWVLPLANASQARVGLADNAFVDSLEYFSAPSITANLPECWRNRGFNGADGAGRGFFFGCGSSGTAPMPAGSAGESVGLPQDGEALVGPYAIEVVSTQNGAGRLDEWLRSHGFQVPNETLGAIRYYVDLQFDFLVMRLRPGAGVQQMQPIRITTRGYSPVLPLRMIAAGVGDQVGLTLMVIAESRMQAHGFDNEVVRESALVFDYSAARSNYRDLYDLALARDPGRTWITESAQNLFESAFGYAPTPRVPGPGDAGLADAHPDAPHVTPDAAQGTDAGTDADADDAAASDDAASDDAGEGLDASASADANASDDAGEGTDAAASADASASDDAAASDDGGMTAPTDPWGYSADPLIDRTVAFAGLQGHAVVTRMRTSLRLEDLNRDLQLEPSADGLLAAEYVAPVLRNAPPCPRSVVCAVTGFATPAALEGLLVLAIVLRVRSRRRRAE